MRCLDFSPQKYASLVFLHCILFQPLFKISCTLCTLAFSISFQIFPINLLHAAQSIIVSFTGSDSNWISSGHTDVTCKTTAEADIILLVDGSWSIGRLNFKTIRAFIARMVGVFDIGPSRVQIGKHHSDHKSYWMPTHSLIGSQYHESRSWIDLLWVHFTGLVQYSGDPKTEWHLNTHKTRAELLDAVANLPYKGGNTLTGMLGLGSMKMLHKPGRIHLKCILTFMAITTAQANSMA